jgi:hypothetical protein
VSPARGEVWRYAPVTGRAGLSTARLIVSAAAINRAEQLPVVLGLQAVDSNPGGLLAVALGEGLGWVSALSVEPVLRGRLTERVAAIEPTIMRQVDQALRAAQGL